MIFRRPVLLITPLAIAILLSSGAWAKEKPSDEKPVPIKALLVTGGCSHDYTTRKNILVQGIRERIKRPIEWMVKHQGDGESDVRIPLFEESEWAKGYDIVVHDYCFPRVREGDYIERILAPHRAGIPAVLIHGTMLSFPTPDDRWASFTGATIRGHDRERPLPVAPLEPSHPVLKGFQPWTISREELYRVDKLAPAATALIGAHPLPPTADRPPPTGLRPPPPDTPVAWTHLYGPSSTRVFATTLGNDLATLITPEYLDLLSRGFLWSLNQLSDSSLVAVSPESSLKGLKIELPRKPLPELGVSEARRGKASALASAGNDEKSPGLAIDGKTSTYWESDAPGPASWQVDLPGVTEVGAAALIWKASPIAPFLVEGSTDGKTWKALADVPRPEGDSTLSILRFDPVGLGHLRVSVPATPVGHVPGIREFAVYSSVEEVPSGLQKGMPDKNSEGQFRTVGESGFERTIRLAPDWSIAARFSLEAGTTPIQVIPTASGNIFLLAESASRPPSSTIRRVLLLVPTDTGSLRSSVFLDGLAPGTVISWDGEWLYTLSSGVLHAYRDLKGAGIANERRRIGRVFSLPEAPSLDTLEFSDMNLEKDGWIHVRFHSPRAWEAYDSRGNSVLLPKQGTARFQRNGRNFSLVSDTGKGGGDEVFEDSGISRIVQAEQLSLSVRDGRILWTAIRTAAESSIVCLTDRPGDPPSSVVWDQVDAAGLFDYVKSDRQSVQREVIPEILRRKRDPAPDLERVLVGGAPTGLRAGLFSALTEVNPARSLPLLLSLAEGADPAGQVLAFRLLGDHPEAPGHAVFRHITTAATPEVTTEILRAISRSGTEMEGLEELVLSFTDHPDPGLSGTARNFLICRRASSACFEALDDPERKGQWKGAFDVLVGIQRATAVEGIVLRLERTTSAEFRRLGLEALCRLYYRDVESKTTWEGTRIAELFLRASLHDHRVDRPRLVDMMLGHGISLPEPEIVATLAQDEIPFEALAVETLLPGAGAPLSPTISTWLADIAGSPSRDAVLRTKAKALLSGAWEPGKNGENDPRVGGMDIATLVKEVAASNGDPETGRGVFDRLACGTCHNIHGEGPVLAPDLATAATTLSPGELIEEIMVPAKRTSPGYGLRLVELQNGAQRRGFLEGRDETEVRLRDRAGNRFTVPVEEIRFEWEEQGSEMPCDSSAALALPEFASLMQFLESLAL